MTDGLALLNQKREQRRRSIPPPRHPAAPLPSAPPNEGVLPLRQEVVDKRDALVELRVDQQPTGSAVAMPDEGETELYRSTIYFGQAEDRFLEEVRGVARRSKPKVDATRSAVVRLAVKRLLNELSPSQVVEELRPQSPRDSTAPGRKRL